jgi:hypothetical protein
VWTWGSEVVTRESSIQVWISFFKKIVPVGLGTTYMNQSVVLWSFISREPDRPTAQSLIGQSRNGKNPGVVIGLQVKSGHTDCKGIKAYTTYTPSQIDPQVLIYYMLPCFLCWPPDADDRISTLLRVTAVWSFPTREICRQ